MSGTFIHEVRAYELLEQAGLAAPRRGLLRASGDAATLPFKAGEEVVVKGVAVDVWHKSDIGLVRFEAFDAARLETLAREMEAIGSAKGAWVGTLVCEKLAFQKISGLPTEALVALRRSSEAGWTVVLGIGGLHTNAWGEEIKPLLWPVALATPEQALADFREHYLGKIWLGRMRQGKALTDEGRIAAFFHGLWKLAELLEAEGATLLEMNPVVLDGAGNPTALDGVGSLEARSQQAAAAAGLAPETLLQRLVAPRSIALAGISSKLGTPGRIILDNLLTSKLPRTAIVPIKPGTAELDGLPCLPGVEALAANPVDMLILCLPAAHSVEAIEQLCRQGGGADVVYLVAGGIGDGADTEGRGQRIMELLESRRGQGLWAPALIGPNGLGFISSEGGLDTLFITQDKLPIETQGGPLALVSQSGAFLVSRLSCMPGAPLRYACSIGNQMDLRLSDFLEALGRDPQVKVVALYAEGFAPGDLMKTSRAAQALKKAGKRVVLYKGGRSAEGQAAASSHTGALAGDWELQKALLRRAGVLVTERMGDFDGAMAWLAAYPEGRPSRVAVATNAGYESVVSADLLEGGLCGHTLEAAEIEQLRAILEANKLSELVNPRLPLDITPMADERAYLECLHLLAKSGADSLVVGLVPLTKRLETVEAGPMEAFARELADLARSSGKRMGVVVEGGPLFEAYRQALRRAGLPVFLSMERALTSLRLIAEN